MPLNAAEKKQIVDGYKQSANDTGSSEVQIALLTERIKQLTEHLKVHKKDNHTRYGLLNLISRRRRLLDYLKRTKIESYRALLKDLGLRR